jgi:phosphoenolpyruvate synthase/pyruvate phosphate dikinase
VAAGHDLAASCSRTAAQSLEAPLAVRSSAADEDGADASFAGQHLTLLNVPSIDD